MKQSLQFLLFLALSIFVISSQAQTYVNDTATGNNDGSSWADAYTDLSEAMDAAPARSEVWIAAGTYLPQVTASTTESWFELSKDLKIYGGFAGTESSIDQRDIEANETILSGDHNGDDLPDNFTTNREDNSLHVIFVTDTVTTASIFDGLHIKNGHTEPDTSSGNRRRGGGMLCYGSPLIQNCTFSQNYGWFGGALYPRGEARGMVVTNCTFRNNSAGWGAGCYVLQQDFQIDNSTFERNTSERSGGGLYTGSSDGAMVKSCYFHENISNNDAWAGGGGGMYISESPTVVDECTFETNATTMRRGAGIFVNSSSATIKNCIFDDNRANQSSGAGVHIYSDSIPIVVTISDSEFKDGSANWAGGISSYNDPVDLQVSNCEFKGNEVIQNGAVVYVGFGSKSTFTGCTFDQNVGSRGGVFSSQNDLTEITVIDCLLSRNEARINGGVAHFFDTDSVQLQGNPKLTIHRSNFLRNDCAEQGGVLNMSNADLDVVNSLFTGNQNFSTENGAGGVMSLNSSGDIVNEFRLTNNTFYANEGPLGAVIGSWTDSIGIANLILQNNIFSNSSTDAYAIEDGTPGLESRGGNLSDDSSLMPYVQAENDTHNEDPMFKEASLGEFDLKMDSPAVDKGVNDGAPELDFYGFERADGLVDKGALEFGAVVSGAEDLEASLAQLQVYPNPVIKQISFTLENNWSGTVYLNVRDMKGQFMTTQTLNKDRESFSGTVDVENLSPGLYLLNINDATHSVTRSFIKQ